MDAHRRTNPRFRQRPWRFNRKQEKPQSFKPKLYQLGSAMNMFFKLLWLYGIHVPDSSRLGSAHCSKFREIVSYVIDFISITPYVIYSILVVDPYYSTRGSTIYWYLIKINLFTFGLSRLIIKSQMVKFAEIRDRLMAFEVEHIILNAALKKCERLVKLVLIAICTSFIAMLMYFIYIIFHCYILVDEEDEDDYGGDYLEVYDRQCTLSMWIYFCAYCLLTSLFTAICFFSFACLAFAFLCCVILRQNLKAVTNNIVTAPTTRGAAEGFVHFCKVHGETHDLIDLLDTVFSKIPLVIILVQISSVSMVLRLPSSTYGILDEKIIACCSCTSNIAMYFIAILWIVSASKLNQEVRVVKVKSRSNNITFSPRMSLRNSSSL